MMVEKERGKKSRDFYDTICVEKDLKMTFSRPSMLMLTTTNRCHVTHEPKGSKKKSKRLHALGPAHAQGSAGRVKRARA